MPPVQPELLDELLKDYEKQDNLLGQDGLLQQLTETLVERALDGELTHHLDYDKHARAWGVRHRSRDKSGHFALKLFDVTTPASGYVMRGTAKNGC